MSEIEHHEKSSQTLYPALEVTELVPGRSTGAVTLRSTVFNQRKELVLEGTQKFLVRRRPAYHSATTVAKARCGTLPTNRSSPSLLAHHCIPSKMQRPGSRSWFNMKR